MDDTGPGTSDTAAGLFDTAPGAERVEALLPDREKRRVT
jgi:hypothetical protein